MNTKMSDSQNMPRITYAIFHDLEERPLRTIPTCWKVTHVIGFLAVSVMGLIGFLLIKNAIELTHECILFADLEINFVEDNQWSIVLEYSDWGTSYDCAMPMLVTMLTFVYGAVFCLLFVMCGTNRYGLTPPSKIVIPGFVTCMIASGVSIYCTKHVTRGLDKFCKNIFRKIHYTLEDRSVVRHENLCGLPGVILRLDGKSVTEEYEFLDLATITLFTQCLIWIFNGIVILSRCLLVTDFVLLNTIVAKYSVDVLPSKQDESDSNLERNVASSIELLSPKPSRGSFSVALYSPTSSERALQSFPSRKNMKILTIRGNDNTFVMKEAIDMYNNDAVVTTAQRLSEVEVEESSESSTVSSDSEIIIYARKLPSPRDSISNYTNKSSTTEKKTPLGHNIFQQDDETRKASLPEESMVFTESRGFIRRYSNVSDTGTTRFESEEDNGSDQPHDIPDDTQNEESQTASSTTKEIDKSKEAHRSSIDNLQAPTTSIAEESESVEHGNVATKQSGIKLKKSSSR